MEQLFQATSEAVDDRMREAWEHSTEVASLSHVLCRHFTKLRPDQAMLAGLIHEIGKLPILVWADYNDWETPRLTDDLGKLKSGEAIVSYVTGLEVKPRKYIIFDSPLGRAHAETARFIDFMVFIDTPLDVAMARRIWRDLPSISAESSSSLADLLKGQLSAYLDYGRQACLEMEKQVKPTCDLILDGCLPADELAKVIVEMIKAGPVPFLDK